MKRILALDGGGIRGVFTLKILEYMELLLRISSGNPNLVLADHFDLFAGTSTGAIIATGLCWGMPVKKILDLYIEFGSAMFTPVSWKSPFRKLFVARYEAEPLSNFLKELFSEPSPDDPHKMVPSLLTSRNLRKALLVVVRNHTTGSAWPLTNNANAIYNDATRPDCNLNIPLWQIVRASTAAPVYFDPEEIILGGRKEIFVDGSITPYTNPALIAALTAILPGYNMKWGAGPDKIRIISVGTMRFSSQLTNATQRLWLGFNAAKIPAALMEGVAWQQDYLCRCLGECIYGEALDSEIGNLMNAELPGSRWFSYVRYNQSYKSGTLEEILKKYPGISQLDAIKAIPMLSDVGSDYASEHVKLEHLI